MMFNANSINRAASRLFNEFPTSFHCCFKVQFEGKEKLSSNPKSRDISNPEKYRNLCGSNFDNHSLSSKERSSGLAKTSVLFSDGRSPVYKMLPVPRINRP